MKLIICVLLFCTAAQGFNAPWKNVEHMSLSRINIPLNRFLPDSLNSRIVGGDEAEPHQFPYQVAVYLQLKNRVAFCGGSLINEEWVLTAAHCASRVTNFTIVLGAHRIHEDEPSQQVFETTEKIIHPKWIRLTVSNDIALIKLPAKVVYDEYIQPIRLPTLSQENVTFAGEDSLVSGWGKDTDSATEVSPVLRYVENPILTNAKCNLLMFNNVKSKQVCMSGKNGKSACNGDSGGPLTILETDGQRTQIGIVSFGIAFGCEKGFPTVYTRVSRYLDFISEHTSITLRP